MISSENNLFIRGRYEEYEPGKYRMIPDAEWNLYEWHDVTTFSSPVQNVYLRGKRIILPPVNSFT